MTNGKNLPDSDWGDFSCRRAVDSSSLNNGLIDLPCLIVLNVSVFMLCAIE